MFFAVSIKTVVALAMLGSVLGAPIQLSTDNQNLDLPIVGGLVNSLPIVGPILNSLTGTLGGLPIVGGLLGGLGGGIGGSLNVGVPGLGAVGVSAGASAGVPVAAVVPQSINTGAAA
ncbi:hypothetical protein ONZ45_g5207 [Pleurotus djamor]|nr:hypothetical protein ONZ45_g5207 [Pleurotus djamor]